MSAFTTEEGHAQESFDVLLQFNTIAAQSQRLVMEAYGVSALPESTYRDLSLRF